LERPTVLENVKEITGAIALITESFTQKLLFSQGLAITKTKFYL